MSNLPPGYDSDLAYYVFLTDIREYAIEAAWEHLADEAPDGIGWDIMTENRDGNSMYVLFQDVFGLTFETTVSLYEDTHP